MVQTSESCGGTSRRPAEKRVEEARLRLADELRTWPPVTSPLLWTRLQSNLSTPPSEGAQVHYIRAARLLGEWRIARDMFVLLLQQIEPDCAGWAAKCIARTPGIRGAEGEALREDLRQELALRLWDEIALRSSPGWELFFPQSLAFAGRHVATTYMQSRGYWRTSSALEPARSAIQIALEESPDPFGGANLADLRRLVDRLPSRLRTAIVLRHWQDASEMEIGKALGGVTTRTVRNYLRQGYALLRNWYGCDVSWDHGETAHTHPSMHS